MIRTIYMASGEKQEPATPAYTCTVEPTQDDIVMLQEPRLALCEVEYEHFVTTAALPTELLDVDAETFIRGMEGK